ncbi:hypothetical protein PSEUDO8O_30645 [Pseudomonas sp. 8O]|nr:hypothetical protein PSEUDO8O_30645 [Pseudomonas sp. 8O]
MVARIRLEVAAILTAWCADARKPLGRFAATFSRGALSVRFES